MQKRFDFGQRRHIETVLRAGLCQHVPPGAQVMQRDAVIGQALRGFGKNVIVKDYRSMRATGPGFADRIDKRQFRSTVRGQILDQPSRWPAVIAPSMRALRP